MNKHVLIDNDIDNLEDDLLEILCAAREGGMQRAVVLQMVKDTYDAPWTLHSDVPLVEAGKTGM
jgi:hypothetical protein